jgi:hypothetical protein
MKANGCVAFRSPGSFRSARSAEPPLRDDMKRSVLAGGRPPPPLKTWQARRRPGPLGAASTWAVGIRVPGARQRSWSQGSAPHPRLWPPDRRGARQGIGPDALAARRRPGPDLARRPACAPRPIFPPNRPGWFSREVAGWFREAGLEVQRVRTPFRMPDLALHVGLKPA